VTWEEYGEDLTGRLADLYGRIHRGAYRAQPSRRVWITKPVWMATTAGNRGAGGQDRSARGRKGSQPDLGRGLPGLLARIPAGHEWMIQFVEPRLGVQRIVRLIQKWLKEGVMEGGKWFGTEEGGTRRDDHRTLRRRWCATSAKGRGGPNVCNCLIDEGRPLGTGLQERVPNRLRWLWSKAMVVSTEGKGLENQVR